MQSIQTRFYTNLMLTVIAILLSVLAFRPQFATNAQAQRSSLERKDDEGPTAGRRDLTRRSDASRNEDIGGSTAGAVGSRLNQATAGDTAVANATLELAAATREIANALKSSAASQAQIADAIGGLRKSAVPGE